MKMREAQRSIFWLLAIAAIAFGLPHVAAESKYFQYMLETIAIFMLAATGLNIAIGFAGQFQMAQGAIMGVAAYSAAVLHLDLAWPVGWSILAAFALAMILGACVALFSARLGSHYLLLATFGFQVVVVGVIRELSSFTGGVNGRPAIAAIEMFGINFTGSTTAYSTALILIGGLGLFACEWIRRSYLGLGMQAARQNERVINASGLFADSFKFLAVAISTAYAAIAGVLVGPVQTFLVPDSFAIEITLLLLVIVILGGAGSTLGVAVSAVVLAVASQIAQNATTAWPLIYGLFIMIMLTLTSRGLAGVTAWLDPVARLLGASSRTGTKRLSTPQVADADRVDWLGGARQRTPSPDPSPDQPVLLTATGLRKSYGGVTALNGVSVNATRGMVLGVVGPNGSGKTTLFELLSGFVRQDEGQIKLFGREISALGPVERARLGVGRSFQHPSVLAECSVAENALLGAMPFVSVQRRLGLIRSDTESNAVQRARHSLDLVGLAHLAREPAGKLSYGQRKL
ncbi:MAG: ATP-binding cassette domain-containing protein, partial [Alphaproteobacteria bacterium]